MERKLWGVFVFSTSLSLLIQAALNGTIKNTEFRINRRLGDLERQVQILNRTKENKTKRDDGNLA